MLSERDDGGHPAGFRLLILPGDDLTPQTERARDALQRFAAEQSNALQPLKVPGTRLPVPAAIPGDNYHHASGGNFRRSETPNPCPSCQTELFPIFRLDMRDERVARLVQWPLGDLELPVCPGCLLGFTDYWADFSPDALVIVQPDLGRTPPFQCITTPYETRAVALRALAPEEYPGEDQLLANHVPGPLHQIGGVPPRWFADYRDMPCYRCSRPMVYAGVVDYDDANVPLFEERPLGRAPVAFCLGDCKSYYFYTCAGCAVVGFRYIT